MQNIYEMNIAKVNIYIYIYKTFLKLMEMFYKSSKVLELKNLKLPGP